MLKKKNTIKKIFIAFMLNYGLKLENDGGKNKH